MVAAACFSAFDPYGTKVVGPMYSITVSGSSHSSVITDWTAVEDNTAHPASGEHVRSGTWKAPHWASTAKVGDPASGHALLPLAVMFRTHDSRPTHASSTAMMMSTVQPATPYAPHAPAISPSLANVTSDIVSPGSHASTGGCCKAAGLMALRREGGWAREAPRRPRARNFGAGHRFLNTAARCCRSRDRPSSRGTVHDRLGRALPSPVRLQDSHRTAPGRWPTAAPSPMCTCQCRCGQLLRCGLSAAGLGPGPCQPQCRCKPYSARQIHGPPLTPSSSCAGAPPSCVAAAMSTRGGVRPLAQQGRNAKSQQQARRHRSKMHRSIGRGKPRAGGARLSSSMRSAPTSSTGGAGRGRRASKAGQP